MKLEPLRKIWMDCKPLERALLVGGIACAGFALMVLILIEPAVSAVRLKRELPDVSARSEQLEALLSQVRALKSRPAVAVAADARLELEQSLASAGLRADPVVPGTDGAVRLTFADVPYAAWSIWLADHERALGMRAVAVTAQATATPGNADVRLELRSERK
jgi:type II secretory pathway component PulM